MYDALRQLGTSGNRTNAFATCGTSWWVLESRTRPGVYKLARDFCHDRWCIPCAHMRAEIVAGNLATAIGSGPARLITLTVRSTDEPLATQLHGLLAGFRRLRRLPLWTDAIDGGAAVLEINFNRQTGRYHPHLHCVTVGRFLPQHWLAEEWCKCTHGSNVVDVRYLRNTEATAKYVTKYLTKPIDHDVYASPPHLQEAITALRGQKQLFTFGSWRHLKLTAPLQEDDWKSLGHWHELLYAYADQHADVCRLIDAIQRSPNRAANGEFVLEDLDDNAPHERPP